MIPLARPSIDQAEIEAVVQVLESRMIAQGERTEILEEAFRSQINVKHAVAVSSGTAALHLALLSHEIGPGDEVIAPSFTFIATVNAILLVGARPIFVDIEPTTFTLDVNLVEALITPRTKAIVPVHLYGHPCRLDRLQQLAGEHKLSIIEDAAQGIGASFSGRAVGGFGTGCFSLYATKNITAGEGGIITTNDPEIARRCRLLRNHGMSQHDHYEMPGFNYRISDLHAAIGSIQIKRLTEFQEKRQRHAEYYSEHIKTLITPAVEGPSIHGWHQYTVRVPPGLSRDAVRDQLHEADIGTGVYYRLPAHKAPHVIKAVGESHLPVTEQIAREVFSIPVRPDISQEELEMITHEINRL